MKVGGDEGNLDTLVSVGEGSEAGQRLHGGFETMAPGGTVFDHQLRAGLTDSTPKILNAIEVLAQSLS